MSHSRFDFFADIDDIRVRCPEDLKAYGLITIESVKLLLLRVIVGNISHIGDGYALFVKGKGFNLVQDLQLTWNPSDITNLFILDVTGRNIDVIVADGVDEVPDLNR